MPASHVGKRVLSGAIVIAGLSLAAQITLLVALWTTTFHPLPWHDEWDAVATLARVTAGDSSLAAWVAQHNEHRLLTGRLVWALDAIWFGGLSLLTFAVTAALACGICFVYATVIVGTPWSPRMKWLAALGVFSLLLCGQQASNLLWAFQVQWFLVHFFVVAAVAAVTQAASPAGSSQHSNRVGFWWLVSVGCGIAANYSVASGNLVWGALLVALVLLRRRIPAWCAVATGVVAVVSVLLYARGFHLSSTASGSVQTLVANPGLGLGFLTRMLGVPFAPLGMHAPVIAGVAFLAGALTFGRRALRSGATVTTRSEAFCGGIIAFVLANAVVTMVGRASLGLEGALESRFASGMSLGWASLLVLLAGWLSAARGTEGTAVAQTREALIIPATGLACAVGLVGAWVPPYDYAPLRAIKTEALAAILAGVNDTSALERVGLYGRPVDRERIEALVAHRWSVFSNRAAVEAYTGAAVLDAVAPRGCDAVILTSEPLPGAHAVKLRGLVRGTADAPRIDILVLTDDTSRSIGAGATVRSALFGAVTVQAEDWVGYVAAGHRRMRAYGGVDGRWLPCSLSRGGDDTVLDFEGAAGVPLTAEVWAQPWLLYQAGQPRYVRAVTGLDSAESFGRWSIGRQVVVEFAAPLPKAFTLELVLGGFGPNVGQPLRVTTGTHSTSVRIGSDLEQMREYYIPVDNTAGGSTLTLEIPVPTPPRALGISSDGRTLGVALQRLRVVPRD